MSPPAAAYTDNEPLLKSPAPKSHPEYVETRSKFQMFWEINRFHKFPTGTTLIFWPCAWALTMTAYRTKLPLQQYWREMAIYAVLSTVLHGAACVVNDMWDRDFDRQERTKNRPLASGAISLGSAATCLLMETGICVGIMSLANDLNIIGIGLIGIFPLHAFYPAMKRVTWWPQAWLGMALSWGYIVVWALHRGRQDIEIPIIAFIGMICWTIFYDTIYGCQDKKDDIKVGIKSTSLLFGNHVRLILSLFGTVFIAAMAVAGYLNHQGPAYFVLSIGGTALHLAWQMATWNVDDPKDCYRKFKSNDTLGYMTLAGMLIDYLKVVL